MKGILLAAQIEGISTRKDRTIKLVIGTQELSPAKGGELLSLSDKIVKIYICEVSIDQTEIDQVDSLNPEFKEKSQSQRLRNTLFVLFGQQSEGFKDFDSFYKHKTEQIITHLKSKLV